MEDNSKVFMPIGNELFSDRKISELVQKLKFYIDDDNIKEEIETLFNFVDNKLKEHKKKYEDIVEYISQFFGKYVHMKFYYNVNYSSTREIEPVWYCDYEVNAYLYRYSPSNYCLFGIYNEIDDYYNGGVRDNSINLYDKLEGHKLEINQITAEDFLNTAKESISKCLIHRLDKVESDEYELTENGYIRKN
jgi:hypothetical protein